MYFATKRYLLSTAFQLQAVLQEGQDFLTLVHKDVVGLDLVEVKGGINAEKLQLRHSKSILLAEASLPPIGLQM